jgi:hypothetical protein
VLAVAHRSRDWGATKGECAAKLPGDELVPDPADVTAGWLGLPDGVTLEVARVDPGRSLVLREQPPQMPWDAVWSFHVLPIGPRRSGSCRAGEGPGSSASRRWPDGSWTRSRS